MGPRALRVAWTTPALLACCSCHVIPSVAGFCPFGATVSASGLNSSRADQSPPRPVLIPPPPSKPKSKLSWLLPLLWDDSTSQLRDKLVCALTRLNVKHFFLIIQYMHNLENWEEHKYQSKIKKH